MSESYEEQMQAYRRLMVEIENKAQDDYDKTILTLSSGALGISFAFIKDVVGNQPLENPNILLTAWSSWGISVLAVLLSYFFSREAHRRVIIQIDENIDDEKEGGVFATITYILNICAGLAFIVGLALIIIFVAQNLR